MKKIMKLSIPLLLGVLLMVALVGVASARPNARPQEQAWRVLTVPPHACIASFDHTPYSLGPSFLRCGFPGCVFYCPVDFPAAGEQAVGAVNVRRLTMYAFDNDGTNQVFAALTKMYPPLGGIEVMAQCTTTDSTDDPQTRRDFSIENNPIYRSQTPYIRVIFGITTGKLYGFYIHYTW
jgi:hypothetical protein